MPINARSKGKQGEYEVIDLFQPLMNEIFEEFGYVAPILRRNTAQYADGGEDIAGMIWHAVEVKRCEKADIGRWWLQTVGEAAKSYVQLPRLENTENKREFLVNKARQATWWDRDLESCGIRGKTKKIPILLWRQNRQPWRVLVPLKTIVGGSAATPTVNITIPSEISWDAFVPWFRFDLRSRLGAWESIKAGLVDRHLA